MPFDPAVDEPITRDMIRLVPCSTCGAPAGQHCAYPQRSKGGAKARREGRNHQQRMQDAQAIGAPRLLQMLSREQLEARERRRPASVALDEDYARAMSADG